MSGLLVQIIARQQKLIEERDKQRKKRKKRRERKVSVSTDTALPSTSVRAEELTQAYLETALREAYRKFQAMSEDTKVIGIPTPLSIHERVEKFLKDHKGEPGMPQSKKSFVLACLLKFLDQYEEAT